MSKSGNQSIGCEVQSCTHYRQGECDLTHITVQPCPTHGENCHSKDETLCGSYRSEI